MIDLTDKCGSCKYMDLNDESISMYRCTKSSRKIPYYERTRVKCMKYELDNTKELIVPSKHIKHYYSVLELEKALDKACELLTGCNLDCMPNCPFKEEYCNCKCESKEEWKAWCLRND